MRLALGISLGLVGGMLSTACTAGPPQGAAAPRKPADVVTEEVHFRWGGNTLAGVLYRPPRAGPHPAVALVLGSDAEDRNYHGVGPALGAHFARHGIACLAWDKPGVGHSGGNYLTQSFRDRAAEALAAVTYLRGRPDIARDRIGLWGHSQGGMVVPLAASLSREVAFVIEVSGWQGPAWQQDPVRVEMELRAEHFPDGQVAEAVAFARKRMDLIRGSGSFKELDRAQVTVLGRPWFGHVHRCDRALFEWARQNVNYDSEPSWEKVHCPVLVIYGENDQSSGPPKPLIAVIRRGLAKAGNRDVTVRVFPGADHSLCRARAAGPKEAAARAAGAPDFVPGYLDTMTDWLAVRFRR